MNQFDALRCSICFNDYDLGDHIPRILPKCGHTVCSKCLDRILEQPKPRCPLDKHSIKRKVNRVFPVNFTVRHILEETSECDMCTVHQKKLKFLCLTDKCKLCKHCVEFSDHKQHTLKPITEAKVEADNKRQKLEQALTVLDEFHKEVGNILEEKKSELSSRIEEGFDELISLMLLKKSCLLFEVDCIFEQEKNKLRYVVGEDSPLRKKILDKIDTFKGFVTKRDFFSIMNFNLLHPSTNLDKSIFQGHVEEFKTNLDGYFDLFNCYFQSQTDMLSKFNIPSQAWVDNLRIGENKEEENQDGISETTWETEDKNCPFEIISSLQINPNNQGYLEIISKDVIPTQVLINIEEWKQMKGIWLQLGQPRLSEQNTRTLAYILSKMEQINSIWITAENQANIFEDDLISLLDLLFARTASLEQISISFNYSRITDRTIVHIADKILSRIVHLNSFEVCLGATYITNQAIRALSRSILPYTETLNTFRLEIGRTGVTEDIVGEMFVSMPKVKNFMLGVSSINLSDRAIENFVKNTLCSMESLELLSLWLQNTKITDQSVIKLFNSIKKVKTLQTSFENTLISDKSMEVLANSNVFKMRDLKDFEINLNGTWVTELTKIHILTLKERLLAEPQRWLQGLEV